MPTTTVLGKTCTGRCNSCYLASVLGQAPTTMFIETTAKDTTTETSTIITTLTTQSTPSTTHAEMEMSTVVTTFISQTIPSTTREANTTATVSTTIAANATATIRAEMESSTAATTFMSQTIPSTRIEASTFATILTRVETSTIPMMSTPRPTTHVTSYNASTCAPPAITLAPSASSLQQSLEFRRNKGFSITSNIQLNCNTSFGTTTQWTIRICTSNCSSQIQIDSTIDTTFTEIYIPAKSLSYGIYQFILTVTMVSAPNVSSSSYTYVKILPTNIIVNVVMYGASMITRGFTQDLVLDPGQFSVDPDDDTFNTSVSALID